MALSFSNEKVKKDELARLLSRGGRTLGLAALAHARGQRSGRGSWYALSPQIRAGAEEILLVLAGDPDPKTLEVAVRAAMAEGPATAAPSWTTSLWDRPEMLAHIGAAVDTALIAPALGKNVGDAGDRTRGLAALAVGFCRSIDTLCAVADHLPKAEAAAVIRMGYLAHVTVAPGQPSRVRGKIRQTLSEAVRGG